MAILAEEFLPLPQRRADFPPPLLRDAGLHIALVGGGLAAAILGALGAEIFSWRGAAATVLAYGTMAVLIMAGLTRHAHPPRFGLANAITLSRAAMTALIFGIAAECLFGVLPVLGVALRWGLAGLAGLILVLDGLDGQAARRHGMASPFGARFDMEADALFILALCFVVTSGGIVGPWLLACGGVRYAFLVACRLNPCLATPLPPLLRRKAIYVAQASAPILAIVPLCPPGLAWQLCAGAFLLVLYSFGADCLWLLTHDKASAPLDAQGHAGEPAGLRGAQG